MDTAKQSQEWITQREGRNDWDTKEHDQVTWREDGYPARLEGQYCLGEQKQEEVRGGGRGRGERERETGTPRRLPDQAGRFVLSEGTETEGGKEGVMGREGARRERERKRGGEGRGGERERLGHQDGYPTRLTGQYCLREVLSEGTETEEEKQRERRESKEHDQEEEYCLREQKQRRKRGEKGGRRERERVRERERKKVGRMKIEGTSRASATTARR